VFLFHAFPLFFVILRASGSINKFGLPTASLGMFSSVYKWHLSFIASHPFFAVNNAIQNKNNNGTQNILFIVLAQTHFIRPKQFSETYVNSHAFQQISDFP